MTKHTDKGSKTRKKERKNVKCFLRRQMNAHLFTSRFTVSQEPLWTSDLLWSKPHFVWIGAFRVKKQSRLQTAQPKEDGITMTVATNCYDVARVYLLAAEWFLLSFLESLLTC